MSIQFVEHQYSIEVVGESHYQKNLREVSLYKELVEKSDLEHKLRVTASLILEDNNKFDPNAVRVDVEGKQVGYLTREDAIKYRKAIAKLDLTGEECTCKAQVFGKRDGYGTKMFLGIWLLIDLDNLTVKPPRKKLFGIF